MTFPSRIWEIHWVLNKDRLTKFIRLLYGKKVTVSTIKCEEVLKIFKFFHAFGMEELLRTLTALLLQRGYAWYTPDALVELYILTKGTVRWELRKHLLRCMNMMKSRIRNCEKYKELDRIDCEALVWSLVSILEQSA